MLTTIYERTSLTQTQIGPTKRKYEKRKVTQKINLNNI